VIKRRKCGKNKLKCIYCSHFKTRTYTDASAIDSVRVQKILKIIEEHGFVKVYRCAESQLVNEYYVHNQTIEKRINPDCKKADDMRRPV